MRKLFDTLQHRLLGLTVLVMASPVALAAQDANQMLESGNTFLRNAVRFAFLFFACVGVFMAGKALMDIKNLRENNETIGKPVARLLIGVALTALSVFIAIVSGTLGVESTTQSELSIG